MIFVEKDKDEKTKENDVMEHKQQLGIFLFIKAVTGSNQKTDIGNDFISYYKRTDITRFPFV